MSKAIELIELEKFTNLNQLKDELSQNYLMRLFIKSKELLAQNVNLWNNLSTKTRIWLNYATDNINIDKPIQELNGLEKYYVKENLAENCTVGMFYEIKIDNQKVIAECYLKEKNQIFFKIGDKIHPYKSNLTVKLIENYNENEHSTFKGYDKPIASLRFIRRHCILSNGTLTISQAKRILKEGGYVDVNYNTIRFEIAYARTFIREIKLLNKWKEQ